MRTAARAAVTYDKEFVAVRHESDLLTPLLHAPLVSLSVRELGYVGAFVMCAMLAFTGAAPQWLAAAGLVLAAAAFFRWRGELPEAYLYYAARAALSAAGPARGRRRGRRRGRALAAAPPGGRAGGSSAVVGPGTEYVPPGDGDGGGNDEASGAPAAAAPRPGRRAPRPALERVVLAGTGAPVDLTLDIGAAHGHAAVTVCVDGAELVRDAANGEGAVTVTMIPRPGVRLFSVLDRAGAEIASHAVEFVGPGPALRPPLPASLEPRADAGGDSSGGDSSGGGGGGGAGGGPRRGR